MRNKKADRKNPEQVLAEILSVAFKHEVGYWKDAPGTDEEKLEKIVALCREAL